MIWSLLQRYSLKLTFALTLLIGIQFPHFLDQYETRLDAHYLESKTQLSHYQKLADLLFAGDLGALVEKHKNSEIALFKAETFILEALIERTDFLKNQKIALQGPLYKRFIFIITQVNEPLFIETQDNYQANIVINQQAIIVGLCVAVVSTLILEMLLMLLPVWANKLIEKQKKS
jgi:ABC-type oligopeptide transport system ATPase subunit